MKFKNKIPQAHVICGFIGSGKTTFAKQLEKETGVMRITKDEWMIRIFGNNPIIDKFAEYDGKVTELSRDIAFQFLEYGNDIIIDEGFWVKSQREEIRNRVEKIGAKYILYYVKCPMNLMKKRIIERNKNIHTDSFVISESMFDNYVKYWNPPKQDEKYILINEQNDIML
jgi:predicted kinase